MSRFINNLIATFVAWSLAIILFVPVLLLFITGFKTEAQAYATPPSIFFTPNITNYFNAITKGNYLDYLCNSVIIVSTSTILAFVLGIPAAYALTYYPGKRTKDIVFWLMSTRFMPPAAIIVAIYILFMRLGLRDTRLGLILIYTGLSLPLVILLMRAYYMDLTADIIEAAQIDGASTLQILWMIILPLSRTGIASTSIIAFIFAWNEFFFSLMLTRTEAPTLPVFMSTFQTSEGLFWAQMSAAATLAVAPTILLGWLAQRSLTRGLTLGAVK
jgi:sorbitol/mannitol transport system permease protein